MDSKLKFLIDSLKDELNSGSVLEEDKEELKLFMNKFLGDNSERTSIMPGLEGGTLKLSDETETSPMNLFDSKEDEHTDYIPSLGLESLFSGGSDLDNEVDRDSLVVSPEPLSDNLVNNMDHSFTLFGKPVSCEESNKYLITPSYEDFMCKENYFKRRREIEKETLSEEFLNRKYSFKNILKSNEDALLNKRCKNILNSFLLFGKSYKNFVESCIDIAYVSTHMSMSNKLFDFRTKITYDKTLEIFKFISDKFGVDLQRFDRLIHRCFDCYCENSNGDFKFGRDFSSYYNLCMDREELDISYISYIYVRDLKDSYSCLVCKREIEENLKYCFNPSALDGSNIYATELIRTYRSLLKGTDMFKYLSRLNRLVDRLATRVILEHDGIVSLKERHKVEIESLFKYCSYDYISELIKIYNLIEGSLSTNRFDSLYEYRNKLV